MPIMISTLTEMIVVIQTARLIQFELPYCDHFLDCQNLHICSLTSPISNQTKIVQLNFKTKSFEEFMPSTPSEVIVVCHTVGKF